jgi:hypothetical protein
MTLANFNIVWSLIINNLKSLPLRSIFNIALSLGSSQKIVRALTIERILDPIIKNQGILKPEVKDGNSELLVKTLFSFITFSRSTRFIFKIVLWFPKLVITLFVLSLTSIDVSVLQSMISWITFGLSNSLTLLLSTVWSILVYIYKTGDVINLNFLKNISEPLNLESLFKNKQTKEIKGIISEISNEETWSSKYKNLIRIGAIFVLQVTIKYFLDTTIVSEYLKQHPWLDKVGDFFRWTSKFGKDINNVLVENLPLVGKAENAVSTVLGGALGYGYYFFDKAIITPSKWGWNTTSNIFDIGVKKPFNYIRSWFSSSEEALAEIKRLKEENENLRDRPLRRRWSNSSFGSIVRNWTTQTATKSTRPRVSTDENTFPNATSVWGNNSAPVTPLTPKGDKAGDKIRGSVEPALSTIGEGSENEKTPKLQNKNLANEEIEEPTIDGFDVGL